MDEKPKLRKAAGDRKAALEKWLRTEGVARYDAFKRDPQSEPASKVFALLRQHHAARANSSPSS